MNEVFDSLAKITQANPNRDLYRGVIERIEFQNKIKGTGSFLKKGEEITSFKPIELFQKRLDMDESIIDQSALLNAFREILETITKTKVKIEYHFERAGDVKHSLADISKTIEEMFNKYPMQKRMYAGIMKTPTNTTLCEPKVCINRPASCAPVIDPKVLPSNTKPKAPFESPIKSFISGIRGTQLIETIPRNRKQTRKEFLANFARWI